MKEYNRKQLLTYTLLKNIHEDVLKDPNK